jgi:hypothetical protein
MGTIHEKLQALEAQRAAEEEAKENLRRIKESMSRNDKEGKDRARLDRFGNLTILQQSGVLDMIADVTGGLEIEVVKPQSPEEKEREGGKFLLFDRMPTVKELRAARKRMDSPGNYWRYELKDPVVTDNLTWDPSVHLDIIKTSRSAGLHGQLDVADVSQVSIAYNGIDLQIFGKECVYQGGVPRGDLQKLRLEDAFVKAFDDPRNIRQTPRGFSPYGPQVYRG